MTLDQGQSAVDRLERAKNLFEFLARAQQLKSSPVRTTDTYARDGEVIWLADLPDHQTVTSAHRGGDPEAEAPLFAVDRVARVAAPEPVEALVVWVSGAIDDPHTAPTLRETVPASRVPHLEPRSYGRGGRGPGPPGGPPRDRGLLRGVA